MPKAGRYDYPARPLDDLIPYLKKIHEVAGPIASREVVAQTLEMAVKGGGFATLMSAMENYGLVETGGGQIKVTELGKRVAFETDTMLQDQAKAEAVSQVELFKDYYAQYRNDVADEKVKVFLRSKGNTDIALIPKIATGIGNLLKNNLHYMTDVHVGGQVPGSIGVGPSGAVSHAFPQQTGGERENVIPLNVNLIEFRMGTYLMRFPMNDRKTAKTVINTLLDKKPEASKEASSEAPVEGNE